MKYGSKKELLRQLLFFEVFAKKSSPTDVGEQ